MNKTTATISSEKGSHYVSLVTRAGVVMAIIVTLATLSMIGSMFVSESLDGDAAQINIAGSLRMQSIRLSRALLIQQNEFYGHGTLSAPAEINTFEQRLRQLRIGLNKQLEIPEIAAIYANLNSQWSTIKRTASQSPERFHPSHVMIDEFVDTIDQLVSALQYHSESKIRVLRIIQSGSLFLILLTAFIALVQITKSIVNPMNQLVEAARQAGKGHFNLINSRPQNNEIGVLSAAFNDMATQLQAMHDRFEQRVQEKTHKLERSNKSLELLYQTSQNLVQAKQDKDYRNLLKKVENNLGYGELVLCLNNEQNHNVIHWLSPISNHPLPTFCGASHSNCQTCLHHNGAEHNFNISKRGEEFGTLRYSDQSGQELEQWQSHLLQTIADNIAVAISLDKKHSQEKLLGLQEERAVIARELHDSLAQSLSYLKLQTALLNKQLDKNLHRDMVKETISDIRSGLSDAYRQLRELLTTFRLQISDASLEVALKATAIEFSQKCDHPIQLDCRIDTSLLSPNEQIHVLQIVREALSNIQRHAQANEAQIQLIYCEQQIQVTIIDNGVGITKEPDASSHHGMNIMHERAETLGATLAFKSNSEGGTVVSLAFVPNQTSPDAHTPVFRPTTVSKQIL
ncbi:MAG: histidine kinase [Arenicella sp.]